MKSLSVLTHIPFILIILVGCFPKESTGMPEINFGSGFFYYKDKTIADDSAMRVYYYKPRNFDPDRPILLIMHGADRKADRITEEDTKSIEEYNVLLILPEYSEQLFPKIESYQYGNVRTKPKELWTFYVNDRIFKLVKRITGSRQEKYYIWGNSAGAQFVHRQLIVGAHQSVKKAFASNAGVYTMPTIDIAPYPYSLEGLNLSNEELKTIFALPFFILLGEDDIIQDSYFLMNDAAMKQGSNRFERGKKFYSIAQREAQVLDTELNWQLITIPGCGHHPNHDMVSKIASLILTE